MADKAENEVQALRDELGQLRQLLVKQAAQLAELQASIKKTNDNVCNFAQDCMRQLGQIARGG